MVATVNGSSPSPDSTEKLIALARGTDREVRGELLELYRSYLTILATAQVDHRLRRRMSASDLVQETMMAAHRDFGKFRGGSQGELVTWLRQILCNCLGHAIERHLHAKKRDLRREVSLENVGKNFDDSVAQLSRLVVDPASTPSQVMLKSEIATELAVELGKLKESYRDVIIYRNLQSLSFDEIAERMGLKVGAARMLWLRAIAKFKEVCEIDPEVGR